MDVQKLAKVLAMAASDNEIEALHALRMAKRLLDGHGADFVELGRRLAEGGPDRAHVEALEDAVFDSRNEIRHLRGELEKLRQGRAPVAEPIPHPSFQEAAKEAAAAIRLRAELANMTEELEVARTEMLRLQAHEIALQEQFRDALAEAGRVAVKLSEADTRRMRLEVENRRLTHANHALKIEFEELESRAVMAPPPAKTKRPPRAKGMPASQYALL